MKQNRAGEMRSVQEWQTVFWDANDEPWFISHSNTYV